MSKNKVRLAINGFGRIGRQAFKIALANPEIEIVAINDLPHPDVLAYLLKYDSNYGIFDKQIGYNADGLTIDGKMYPVYNEKDPANLPWQSLNVDVVIESTGHFTDTETASAHLKAGAKKVIISAPAKDGTTPTIVLGVNEAAYTGQSIISNASCTTNCITPIVDVLHNKFGIEKVMMTTIHSYTAEQNLVDSPPPGLHSGDLRRARAAAQNIVPTTTGAAIAATEALPALKGLFHGLSIRVPNAVGSLSDFVAILKTKTTKEELNDAFVEASKLPHYAGKIEVTFDQIVSSDIVGNTASAIVDASLTEVLDGNFVKVVAWYDNEFGYANRLVEQVLLVGQYGAK